ncbi:hypothetical protein BDV40DRAFT_10698 [Aspergillus tamarii]|uniref:Uncharacterized protein n=1 Tax=Aspergillus tamarii TaxID=41984 RepID=A0A5N6UJD8_ASPTM|nr:hypothetical protein BDV40DRAFT_10698 [Aspergillus tamarii]
MLRYAIHTTYKYQVGWVLIMGSRTAMRGSYHADYVYVYGYVLWFDMSLCDFWVFLLCCFPWSMTLGWKNIGVYIASCFVVMYQFWDTLT